MDIIVRKWIDRKPQRLFSHTNWTYASFYTFSFSFLYNNLYRQVNVLLWRHQWRKFRRERMNVYITSRDIRWTSVTSHQAHAHPPTIVVFFVDPQQPPGGNQEKKKRLSCQCCKSLYTSDSTSAYGQQSKWVNHMQIPATHKQPDNTHTHTQESGPIKYKSLPSFHLILLLFCHYHLVSLLHVKRKLHIGPDKM